MVYNTTMAVDNLNNNNFWPSLKAPLPPISDEDLEYLFMIDKEEILWRDNQPNYSFQELMKIYVSMIKHITSKDMVVSMRSKKKAYRDEVEYSLNDDLVKEHIGLNAWKNPMLRDFAEKAVNMFEMVHDIGSSDIFID